MSYMYRRWVACQCGGWRRERKDERADVERIRAEQLALILKALQRYPERVARLKARWSGDK